MASQNYVKTYQFPFKIGGFVYLLRGDDYVRAKIECFVIRQNHVWMEVVPGCYGYGRIKFSCEDCIQGNKKDPPGFACDQVELKKNKQNKDLWEIADLGKTVFLKKEDAEKALKQRKDNKK